MINPSFVRDSALAIETTERHSSFRCSVSVDNIDIVREFATKINCLAQIAKNYENCVSGQQCYAGTSA